MRVTSTHKSRHSTTDYSATPPHIRRCMASRGEDFTSIPAVSSPYIVIRDFCQLPYWLSTSYEEPQGLYDPQPAFMLYPSLNLQQRLVLHQIPALSPLRDCSATNFFSLSKTMQLLHFYRRRSVPTHGRSGFALLAFQQKDYCFYSR